MARAKKINVTDRFLKISGVVFLLFIGLVVVSVIIVVLGFKEYEKANAECVRLSRAEVYNALENAPKNDDGSSQMSDITMNEFENNIEVTYHQCMSARGIPDSILEYKSPYLFD